MAMDSKRTFSMKQGWSIYVWSWLRHLIIPIVCVLALIGGLAAGYVYLGGHPMSDVWEWDTWKHLYDLIFSDT